MSENVLFFVNVVTQPEKEPVHSMNDNDNENDNDNDNDNDNEYYFI